MSSSTGINQHLSTFVKSNWFLILGIILLLCCSCINSKPTNADQFSEHRIIDSHYPTVLFSDDSNFVERAAPRLGRASPRLGRASPRLGRRAQAFMGSQLNHAGRFYDADDDDAINDYLNNIESSIQERRAAPRLGRAVELHEQQKKA